MIAEALIKAGDQHVEVRMEAIRDEFIKWRNSPENNRAPGNACLEAIRSMEKGVHWAESGVTDSKGCGSAMRAALWYPANGDVLHQLKKVNAI